MIEKLKKELIRHIQEQGSTPLTREEEMNELEVALFEARLKSYFNTNKREGEVEL